MELEGQVSNSKAKQTCGSVTIEIRDMRFVAKDGGTPLSLRTAALAVSYSIVQPHSSTLKDILLRETSVTICVTLEMDRVECSR